MASATASTLSTLCSSFTTHCSIKPQFSISHQPFSSRFPSHNLSFSQRLPLLPVPKSTESAAALVESESESESQVSESESSQIVQSPPSWEKGLFAVVMVSFQCLFFNVECGLGYPFV